MCHRFLFVQAQSIKLYRAVVPLTFNKFHQLFLGNLEGMEGGGGAVDDGGGDDDVSGACSYVGQISEAVWPTKRKHCHRFALWCEIAGERGEGGGG